MAVPTRSAKVLRSPLILGMWFLLGAGACWLLRGWSVQSGDFAQYQERTDYGIRGPIYHVREPGAVLLWQGLAWLAPGESTTAPPGIRDTVGDGTPQRYLTLRQRVVGFDLLSALCGGAFLVCLLGSLRELGPAGRGTYLLAAAIVLASAVTWTFVGHIEFYAPLYAALMFYYWRAIRYFRVRSAGNFMWVFAAAALVVTMHRVAVFHLPALVLLFRNPKGSGGFRRPTRMELGVMAGAALAVCLPHILIVGVAAVTLRPFYVMETYNWLPELLTPWTRGWADYVRVHSRLGSFHWFTFGSVAHVKHVLFFWAVGSPLGIPVTAWLRRHLRGEGEKFLLWSAVCAGVWAILWHPHMSYGDWDLFCNPSLPLNLLAATLLIRAWSTQPTTGISFETSGCAVARR